MSPPELFSFYFKTLLKSNIMNLCFVSFVPNQIFQNWISQRIILYPYHNTNKVCRLIKFLIVEKCLPLHWDVDFHAELLSLNRLFEACILIWYFYNMAKSKTATKTVLTNPKDKGSEEVKSGQKDWSDQFYNLTIKYINQNNR